mgnify:FL=1
MRVTVHTEGFKELQKVFKSLPPDVANTVLGEGVMAGARHIAKSAKAAAPRHQGQQSQASKQYGTGKQNIKARKLKKQYKNKRAAIVTRGRAFWLDLLNRGTRYIPATRWYERAFEASIAEAMKIQKAYMVAKVTQLSLKAIQRYGANKK